MKQTDKKYIFTSTTSGDRTNIMASFQLWDNEMFMEDVKKNSHYGRYRYGVIGGWVNLLKDMTLEEFDTVFDAEDFTKEQITSLFRKDISLKYGIHGEQAKIKPLGKKDLERGYTYETVSGQQYLYLGEVERITDKTYLRNYQSDKKPIETEKGFGFLWVYSNWKVKITPESAHVLKSIRKFSKKVDTPKIELDQQYIYESGKQHWQSNESKVILNLL